MSAYRRPVECHWAKPCCLRVAARREQSATRDRYIFQRLGGVERSILIQPIIQTIQQRIIEADAGMNHGVCHFVLAAMRCRHEAPAGILRDFL